LYIYHVGARFVYLVRCLDEADLISIFDDVRNPRFRIDERAQTTIRTRILVSVNRTHVGLDIRILIDEVEKQILRECCYATLARRERANERKAQSVALHRTVY
jgi:hypothetical protein